MSMNSSADSCAYPMVQTRRQIDSKHFFIRRKRRNRKATILKAIDFSEPYIGTILNFLVGHPRVINPIYHSVTVLNIQWRHAE
jgi:hypothetical protein